MPSGSSGKSGCSRRTPSTLKYSRGRPSLPVEISAAQNSELPDRGVQQTAYPLNARTPATRLTLEHPHELDVGRPEKLIDRGHVAQQKPIVDEDTGVAREGRRV